MDSFVTWEMLTTYATLVSVVYMVVEFTKELPLIKELRTKYLAWIVSFGLIVIANLVMGNFILVDVVLYSLSAISISLATNGLHDFNRKVLDDKEE